VLVLALINVWSLAQWFLIVPKQYRRKSIIKYLKTQSKYGGSEKERMMLDSFIDDYCHLDGAFIFSLTKRNTNFVTASEIICALWSKYNRDYTRSSEMKNLLDVKNYECSIHDEIDSMPLNTNKSCV
jgi:hypothetical protein